MSSVASHSSVGTAEGIRAAIDRACRCVAPSWPLDRQIAANPYAGWTDRPFPRAATALHRLCGARLTLPREAYLQAWEAGEIGPVSLKRALDERGTAATPASVVEDLHASGKAGSGMPLPSDLLDAQAARCSAPRWRDTITQQVSQYCASFFDRDEADWQRPSAGGLFVGWREALTADHALSALMHAPEISARALTLPSCAIDAISWALVRLQIREHQATDFLTSCLLRINGWASWCAYLGWQTRLEGGTDSHLTELLAVRACWEALLVGENGTDWLEREWHAAWERASQAPCASDISLTLLWQRAHEIEYQSGLIRQLSAVTAVPTATAAPGPAIQLIFCIDTRSERMRRALEAADGGLETRGFAGFFGLPIAYRPCGTALSQPRLPGLLAASRLVTESTGRRDQDAAIVARRHRKLRSKRNLQWLLRSPTGAFSFVETLGIGYAGRLLRQHFGIAAAPLSSFALTRRDAHALRPRLAPAPNKTSEVVPDAELVAAILRAMGLTRGFARLLVIVGHASQSANNPQAATLDCGACGGQSGELNARLLCSLLNDPGVRQALRARDIDIPADTVVVAALHNTTTDEMTLLDAADLPPSHADDLRRLQHRLDAASRQTRAERAPDLGLGHLVSEPRRLLRRLRQRARDWAETRPEWGLANNAAFIVAPRGRTRGLDLAGRTFLHDYVPAADTDGRILEQIMTAPMIVTHWINLQYYASTVDPQRFGSGNKTLHNVACGRIGLFEGNTGDLRIGLSHQSLHDGQRRMHAPLRLSVMIDAPRERIDSVILRHESVRHLVVHQWLYLFRFARDGFEWHRDERWQRWNPVSQVP